MRELGKVVIGFDRHLWMQPPFYKTGVDMRTASVNC
jgi:hypothetical protein